MSLFTEREIVYLQDQRLERLATVDASGRPHVVRIIPERIVGWGIDSDAYEANARSVVR